MVVTRWRILVCGAGAIGLLVAAALARGARAVTVSRVSEPFASPGDHDQGDLCADVGQGRACWGADLVGPGCERGACSFPRPIPAGPASPAGWRCDGMGAARVCEERDRNAGAWACEGGACAQPDPRMPDDGEWSCVDTAGVVYCRGRLAAAGVLPSRPDLGWLCGVRRGGSPGERVCVDLAPDLPTHTPTRCQFRYEASDATRICAPDEATRVGDACSEERRCPTGTSCVAGRCLPPRPEPSCWFDADCGPGGRCRWGTCATGAGAAR